MEMNIEMVMDRKKVADSIHDIIAIGVDLLKKPKMDQADFGKVKVLRSLGTHVNAAITMIQQETAQQRMALLISRMEQLGYEAPKGIEGK